MRDSAIVQAGGERAAVRRSLDLKTLVGSGEKIGLLVLPILVAGVAANVWRPEIFSVGGPTDLLRLVSAIMLVPGITVWLWSVALILMKVPRRELISGGPYALVKHPLYVGVALLVLPWAGFLLDTWLGVALGAALYLGSRLYAPAEERALAATFGARWDEYAAGVRLPWL